MTDVWNRVVMCDVCGAPAAGTGRVDAADGPMTGYLCDVHAEDMAELLDEWRPFEQGDDRG